MITLITGTPGSGKSLRAVYLITQALQEGRPVYSDIDGINLEGVSPAPDDWRDTPEGSLVVYDEVQRKWPSSGRPGHAEAEDIRALEIHRHTGHDIIVITQHPTLVHHHVRKLVGLHVHVRRTSGAHAVSLFSASEVFDPKDNHELRNADKQLWRYPKTLFSAYKSATQHTHKFKIPAKLKFLSIFIILLFSFLTYKYITWDKPWDDKQVSIQTVEPPRAESAARPAATDTRQTDTATLPAHYQAVIAAAEVDPFPVMSGCIETGINCRCWNESGLPLPLDLEQCRILSAHMPRRLGGFESQRTPEPPPVPESPTPERVTMSSITPAPASVFAPGLSEPIAHNF